MEFWAIEVKSGATVIVEPGHDMVLHLSQANLGEIKKGKGNENVHLFVNIVDEKKKLVLGTLSSERLPQQQFDLVFDKDFELSHNWKGGSVYFFGYKAANDIGEEETDGSELLESSASEDEDDDIPVDLDINGKPETKVKEEKSVDAKRLNAGKDSSTEKKVNLETANGLPKSEGSEEEDSDEDADSISDDEGTDMDEDDDDDSDDENESEEEEEPAKPAPGKKRGSDAEPETPASKKKAKLITPQKTDGKKGGVHVATPHPAKGKTPATQNPKSPKSSGGSHVCTSCSRSFGSEGALDSHAKAKHSAGK